MESRIVESIHRSNASGFGAVVDEGTVALGNQEDTFDVGRSISGEVILQVRDLYLRRQIPNP